MTISFLLYNRISLSLHVRNLRRLLDFGLGDFQFGPGGGCSARRSLADSIRVKHLVTLFLNDSVEQDIFRSTAKALSEDITTLAGTLDLAVHLLVLSLTQKGEKFVVGQRGLHLVCAEPLALYRGGWRKNLAGNAHKLAVITRPFFQICHLRLQ